MISALFQLPAEQQEALRKVSGVQGVGFKRSAAGPQEQLSKEKLEEKIVPLPKGTNLEEALRIAGEHNLSRGLAFRNNGAWAGLRLPTGEADKQWQKITGAEQPGQFIFEIPRLPAEITSEALEKQMLTDLK